MSRWAEQALAEWRGYREPGNPDARVSDIGSALRELMPKLGLADALDEGAVRVAWERIVGSFIASQSVPDRMRGGTLYVRVLHASVRFELERIWKAEIARKLSAEFGEAKIRQVKFFG